MVKATTERCCCGAGDVVQKISRRVIRKLRQLGYLEADIDAVAPAYDPLASEEPGLTRTMAASGKLSALVPLLQGHLVRRSHSRGASAKVCFNFLSALLG